MTTTVLPSYDDAIARYKPVIGLETHVELATATKLFCGCPTAFGADPNTQVCPVCLGLPGSLPVANRVGMEATLRLGLALNFDSASGPIWSGKTTSTRTCRKTSRPPPVRTAALRRRPPDGGRRRDATGSVSNGLHLRRRTPARPCTSAGPPAASTVQTESLVDYNRAGIPLVEIVTKPVSGIGSLAPEVARAYVSELRDIIRSLGVSDVRMEQGSLRCDVNTLAQPAGPRSGARVPRRRTSTRCARWNAPSDPRFIRQASVLDSGGRIVQETRHFHEDRGDTSPGRSQGDKRPTTAISPSRTWCRSPPDPAWVESSSPASPAEARTSSRRGRLREGVGDQRDGHADRWPTRARSS